MRAGEGRYFHLALCIQHETGVPIISGAGEPSPSLADFELLAQVVSAYRMLDVYLASRQFLPLVEVSPRLTSPIGFTEYHCLYDWTQGPGELTNEMDTDLKQEAKPESKGAFLNLVKNKIRFGANASISLKLSNLYTCAMYALSLCSPTVEKVSIKILIMETRKAQPHKDPFAPATINRFFADWCARASAEPEL